MMNLTDLRTTRLLAVLVVTATAALNAQRPTPAAPPFEKIGDRRFRMGPMVVDQAAKELSVPGKVNRVTFLEWVANTPGGMKAYESAFTIDTLAVPFNAGLLLLGLDPAHARVPTHHFDAVPPKGDPVELWVEYQLPNKPKQRVRIEQFLYDKVKKVTLPEGPWVYTGSTFVQGTNKYMAELDGVLIGFVHSPAPVLENPGAGAVNRFGDIVFNESLGVPPDTPITLIVKIPGQKKGK